MSGTFTAGTIFGLLLGAIAALALLTRFVASDLDGFRRWLDKGGVL